MNVDIVRKKIAVGEAIANLYLAACASNDYEAACVSYEYDLSGDNKMWQRFGYNRIMRQAAARGDIPILIQATP